MKSFRPSVHPERVPGAGAVPAIHVVSRSSPPRPRWKGLYAALIAVSALGVVLHVIVHRHVLIELADTGFALALFAVLAGWVSLNRIALARLDEPDAGVGKPTVRIIRSRPPLDERVALPYDFD